jgi:hypothetical protein
MAERGAESVNRHDWDDQLSEYVDGELGGVERAKLEAHLSGCARCRGLVDDLRRVVERARPLRDGSPPATDLWPGILARLEPRDARGAKVTDLRRHPWFARRLTVSLPQALAAAAALVAVTGVTAWFLGSRATPPAGDRVATVVRPEPVPAPADDPTSEAAPPTQDVSPAESAPARQPRSAGARGGTPADWALAAYTDPRYDAAIAELELALARGRGTLDPNTIRILEQNLAIIDRAVAEARRAVAADPANTYLRDHLAATMRRKVDLLRRATVIAGVHG